MAYVSMKQMLETGVHSVTRPAVGTPRCARSFSAPVVSISSSPTSGKAVLHRPRQNRELTAVACCYRKMRL